MNSVKNTILSVIAVTAFVVAGSYGLSSIKAQDNGFDLFNDDTDPTPTPTRTSPTPTDTDNDTTPTPTDTDTDTIDDEDMTEVPEAAPQTGFGTLGR